MPRDRELVVWVILLTIVEMCLAVLIVILISIIRTKFADLSSFSYAGMNLALLSVPVLLFGLVGVLLVKIMIGEEVQVSYVTPNVEK